ncbi:Tkl protein kinase, partial [Globisporangium splendens]
MVDERSRETNAAVSLLLSSFSSDGEGNSDLNNQSYSGEDGTTELFSLIVDDSEQEEDEQSSESNSVVSSSSSSISSDSEGGLVSNDQLHFEAEDATELIRELKYTTSTIAMTLKANLRLFSLENDGSSCATTKVAPANTATEIAQNVYSAPECFYDRIIRLGCHPTDTKVTRLCYLLARVEDNLRTAVSATSVARLARSQKVAEVNHVLYAELDRIMDLLAVPSFDALAPGSKMLVISTSEFLDLEMLLASEAHNALSSARSNDNMWDQSGRLVVADSPPKWRLALRDITFRVSDAIGEGAFGKGYKGTWLGIPVVAKFMGFDEDPGTVSTKLLLSWNLGVVSAELSTYHQAFRSEPHQQTLLGLEGNRDGKWRKLFEVALDVQHMHSLNIVHNDLKCTNILVGERGDTNITDFSLSCILDVAEIQVDPKRISGVHWKSPEYLKGERPAIATDIYSLAMCILEVMTDDIPWGRNMIDAVVRVRVKQGFIPNRPATLSDTQWNLIELMTETDPSQRVKIEFVVNKLDEIIRDEAREAGMEQGPSIPP